MALLTETKKPKKLYLKTLVLWPEKNYDVKMNDVYFSTKRLSLRDWNSMSIFQRISVTRHDNELQKFFSLRNSLESFISVQSERPT